MENQENSSEKKKADKNSSRNINSDKSSKDSAQNQNQNWDVAQHRLQAGPRGYNDTSGIIKGEKENGMERMEEKDPEDQRDLNENNKKK